MTRVIRVLAMLAIATGVPLAMHAQNTWGKKGDQAKVQETKAQTTSNPEHRRWGWIHPRHRDADARPAGWAHGRKVGWQGRNVPPAQARRDDERWYHWHHHHKHKRHHHHHDWDRDHDRD